jgi:sigma-54 dependent transcriptional regulator, acetoin dehydrogenase operon transcriptional activator AcoR
LLIAGEAHAPAPVTRAASKSDRSLRQAVHRHIASVLDEVGGNKRRAARELGVSRATLERKLQEMTKAARR